jgi:hypothetical protein
MFPFVIFFFFILKNINNQLKWAKIKKIENSSLPDEQSFHQD